MKTLYTLPLLLTIPTITIADKCRFYGKIGIDKAYHMKVCISDTPTSTGRSNYSFDSSTIYRGYGKGVPPTGERTKRISITKLDGKL